LADYVQQQHICALNLMSSLSSISTMTTQLEKITNSLGKSMHCTKYRNKKHCDWAGKTRKRKKFLKIISQFIGFNFIIVIFIALTEKLLADTELQLEILEENVKDKNLDKLMNDYAKKMLLLQDEKYAEFEQLKSILPITEKKKHVKN